MTNIIDSKIYIDFITNFNIYFAMLSAIRR